jgi:hypothetical protein
MSFDDIRIVLAFITVRQPERIIRSCFFFKEGGFFDFIAQIAAPDFPSIYRSLALASSTSLNTSGLSLYILLASVREGVLGNLLL